MLLLYYNAQLKMLLIFVQYKFIIIVMIMTMIMLMIIKPKNTEKVIFCFTVGLELPSYHVDSKCHGRQEI